MGGLLPDIEGAAFEGLRTRLDLLGARPPQVLLLDGGDEAQRWAAARYWACRCNCPRADAAGRPCLSCSVCGQIAEGEHLDALAFDGRVSNRQDAEAPGPVRALSVENIRALKGLLKDPPHGEGRRVVMLAGLERSRAGAANALLKALEEPSETTLFVLLAAQREQLLPTLVSRSHCLLLPWPDPEGRGGEGAAELEAALDEFLRTGRGFLSRTAEKGYDLAQARAALDLLRKALARSLAGRAGEGGLAASLGRLSPEAAGSLSRWTDEASDMLAAQVTPARVMDALLSRAHLLVLGELGR